MPPLKRNPNIALTVGCLKGVGPELAHSVRKKLKDKCNITLFYGDVPPHKDATQLSDAECGHLSFNGFNSAIKSVLARQHDAIVTCPINKQHWNMAGVPFPGHTECLAHKTDTEKFAMMMASPKLKVTLVTIHEAIKDVPNKITIQRIFDAAHLTHDVLKTRFRIARPKIAVAALNPHSGDSGLFGDEEEKIIAPAIDKLNGASILTSGPYPADSIFHKAANGEYDAVVSMYHDQGLTAVKTLDFNGTVNISLGVPIIRTSVDHGTAEGIANKGLASDANLIAAVEMAVQMIEKGENNE